jgi:cytochrome c oxidase assembly factor CtaG
MLQHMTLMMVAPPLILLGAPLIPLVRGLPIFAAREFAGPFLRWRIANRVGAWLTRPVVALLLMGAAMFAWHTPRLYELALASSAWHEVEHACFFLASLIFWWPVVQPWPSRAQWPRWAMVPYLLLGDVQNTVLSAILVFSDRVIYPSYATMPHLFRFSALQDQAAAGAIMWVVGSLAFLVPAVVIAIECLQCRAYRVEFGYAGKRGAAWLDGVFEFAERFSVGYRPLKTKLGARAVEAIWFALLFVVTGLALAGLASRPSDDDDQVVRLQQQSGPFAVTVFAPAGDLESGATSFSVLIQDSKTQDVLRDATLEFNARQKEDASKTHTALGSGDDTSKTLSALDREDDPSKTFLARGSKDNASKAFAARGSKDDVSKSLSARGSIEDTENKLLQSAELNFPAEGDWTLHIAVQQNSQQADFAMPLRVMKSETGMTISAWPWFTLLALTLVLLLTYSVRHRRAASSSVGSPGSIESADAKVAVPGRPAGLS